MRVRQPRRGRSRRQRRSQKHSQQHLRGPCGTRRIAEHFAFDEHSALGAWEEPVTTDELPRCNCWPSGAPEAEARDCLRAARDRRGARLVRCDFRQPPMPGSASGQVETDRVTTPAA
mmetsp:Transcript_10161/g.23194  ORF Transcript_10161/g.23194 Transcript_10161/m.23194 type:complete len:117 (-) Transcript_10161:197-547(-)